MWEPIVCGVIPGVGCCGKSRGVLRLSTSSWAHEAKEREDLWGCFNFHCVEPQIVPFLSGIVHQQLSLASALTL